MSLTRLLHRYSPPLPPPYLSVFISFYLRTDLIRDEKEVLSVSIHEERIFVCKNFKSSGSTEAVELRSHATENVLHLVNQF